MGVQPTSAEGLSLSASLGQPAPPEGITIHAIVPNRSGSHILTVDGQIPSELHRPGQNTYEQTLACIGFWAANIYLTPDVRIVPLKAGNITYLAKAIPNDTKLPDKSLWQRVPDEFGSTLPNRQRIVSYGTLLLSLH